MVGWSQGQLYELRRLTSAHMLVGEELGRADRGRAVAVWLSRALTRCERSKRLIVAAGPTGDVVGATHTGELDAVEVERHAPVLDKVFCGTRLHRVRDSAPIDETFRSEADRSLIVAVVAVLSRAFACPISPARAIVFARISIGPARQDVVVIWVTHGASSNDWHASVTHRVVHLAHCVDSASGVRVVA